MISETVHACQDPQTGPHNACHHPTPPPAGFRRCQGDPGCQIRLPAGDKWPLLCSEHERMAAIRLSTEMDRYHELMSAGERR